MRIFAVHHVCLCLMSLLLADAFILPFRPFRRLRQGIPPPSANGMEFYNAMSRFMTIFLPFKSVSMAFRTIDTMIIMNTLMQKLQFMGTALQQFGNRNGNNLGLTDNLGMLGLNNLGMNNLGMLGLNMRNLGMLGLGMNNLNNLAGNAGNAQGLASDSVMNSLSNANSLNDLISNAVMNGINGNGMDSSMTNGMMSNNGNGGSMMNNMGIMGMGGSVVSSIFSTVRALSRDTCLRRLVCELTLDNHKRQKRDVSNMMQVKNPQDNGAEQRINISLKLLGLPGFASSASASSSTAPSSTPSPTATSSDTTSSSSGNVCEKLFRNCPYDSFDMANALKKLLNVWHELKVPKVVKINLVEPSDAGRTHFYHHDLI